MSHPPQPGPDFPLKDKAAHWTLYCALAWLVARALRRGHGLTLWHTFALSILLASAYGASDEFHQRFVPHRTCDPADWVADTLGTTAAAAAFLAYETRRSEKTNRQPA